MRAVSVYPGISMAHYGENPYGEPLYRVIFSDSRTDLQGGKWPDGTCEYREVFRYPGVKHKWILEVWKSPIESAGTPQHYELEQWDAESHLLSNGPYPHRGEYWLCHEFIGEPTEMQVGWAVHNNKVSRDLTAGQRKEGIMTPLEKQQREQDQRFSDIWDGAMGPWQKADAVVSMSAGHQQSRQGFKRGADMPLERFSQTAPLPTQDGFFGTMGKKTAEKIKGA